LVLLLIVHTLSLSTLEIRAKQFLPGSEGVRRTGRGQGKREGAEGKGEK
jgi:hypothetical protein